jgi:HPt (histidine-containing phosphotransfer) domain-containing protein
VNELLAKFLPRFLKLAGERLGRIEEQLAAETPAPAPVVSEMHAIAGEAGLIGLPELANLARDGERTIKTGWNLENIERVRQITADLRRELDALAARQVSSP